MTPFWLAAVLAGLAAVTTLFAIQRIAWAVTFAAVFTAAAAVVLIDLSKGLPIAGAPTPPFVLWAAVSQYSWASPDRHGPPRTYAWMPPGDMMRALRKGQPLSVTGPAGKKTGVQTFQDGAEQPHGYEWVPLEPEGAEKPE